MVKILHPKLGEIEVQEKTKKKLLENGILKEEKKVRQTKQEKSEIQTK